MKNAKYMSLEVLLSTLMGYGLVRVVFNGSVAAANRR